MTTKSNFLFLQDKHQTNNNASQIDKKNHYSTLNLNQNYKCPTLIPVESWSKSFKNKNCDFTETREEKEKFQSWNKSSKFSNLSNFNNKVVGEEEIKKDWKNDTTNKSTLSLHIAAYENSTDILSDQLNDLKKFGSTKKQIIAVAAVKFDIQNPFEFPRQQESEEISEPEVSQFRATQRLINPNEALLDFDENNNEILLETAISQSSYQGDITDFEENRIIESIVRLRDILSEESDEDYTQTDYTSEYSLLTPSDSYELGSTIDEDIPRAEVVAATLDQIQQLLEEAQANNDMIEAEAAWANLDNVEPGSIFTRACRALIRLPFIFLRAAVMGIWELNMMIFKIPLHLFYFIQGTFYGIATIFAGSSSPSRQIEENEQLELISQSTQNDDSNVEEEGQQQRQTCGSEEITFEENIEFDRCSTELNGISEYNESLGACIDHESSEYEGEELEKGYVRLSEAQALQNSPFPSRYFSTYAPSNSSDVETFRTFFEPPSQILIASDRDEIDTRAPMPLYDLHRRQGNCDNQEF